MYRLARQHTFTLPNDLFHEQRSGFFGHANRVAARRAQRQQRGFDRATVFVPVATVFWAKAGCSQILTGPGQFHNGLRSVADIG